MQPRVVKKNCHLYGEGWGHSGKVAMLFRAECRDLHLIQSFPIARINIKDNLCPNPF